LRRGVTLLEAVAAIAIVGMTSVAALEAAGGEMRTAERARRAIEVAHRRLVARGKRRRRFAIGVDECETVLILVTLDLRDDLEPAVERFDDRAVDL